MTMTKIDDNTMEEITTEAIQYSKEELEERKVRIEKQLSDINTKLDLFK